MVCFLACHDVTQRRGLAIASLYLSSNTEGNMAVEGFECSPNIGKNNKSNFKKLQKIWDLIRQLPCWLDARISQASNSFTKGGKTGNSL